MSIGSARKEVLSEVRGGRTAKHPWDEQIKSRQDAIRRRYLDYAAELQRSGAARITRSHARFGNSSRTCPRSKPAGMC